MALRDLGWKNDASRHEELVGFLFIFPAVLLTIMLVVAPIFVSFYLSLTDYNIIKAPVWRGLNNYAKILFGDRRIGRIYLNSLLYTLMAVVGNVGFGLLLAVFLNKIVPKWFTSLLRFSFFLPVIIAYIYVAIVWRALLATDRGIINYLLEQLGMQKVGWLTDKRIAMTSIIIMDTWKNAGYYMVILLSGLQDIPVQYYEAARIDGCGRFRMLANLILPLLSPTIFFCITWSSIQAMQAFDSMSILTAGGPGDASRGIVLYIYEVGFQGVKFGYASAIAVTLFVVVASITFIQFRLSKKWVHY